MTFNFQPTEGSGFERMLTHVSAEARLLIKKMLAYNPDDRITARQVLKDAYFADLREMEQPKIAPSPALTGKLYSGDGDNPSSNEDSMRASEAGREDIPSLPPIKGKPVVSRKLLPPAIAHNSSNKSITMDLKAGQKRGKNYVSPYGRKFYRNG